MTVPFRSSEGLGGGKRILSGFYLTNWQRSHNLGKFPQIFAVSMGVVLGIMRILCIPFKILLFG